MSFVVEEETGTVRTDAHPHNGYYAGDFSASPVRTVLRAVGGGGRESNPPDPDAGPLRF